MEKHLLLPKKNEDDAEVIPKERENQYFDYSEMKEIDSIIEEYFNAA